MGAWGCASRIFKDWLLGLERAMGETTRAPMFCLFLGLRERENGTFAFVDDFGKLGFVDEVLLLDGARLLRGLTTTSCF